LIYKPGSVLIAEGQSSILHMYCYICHAIYLWTRTSSSQTFTPLQLLATSWSCSKVGFT